MKKICPVCGTSHLKKFLAIHQMPVLNNVFYKSKNQALNVPKEDIILGYCSHCDFITNMVFDENLIHYSNLYENSLHYSQVFQQYALELAEDLLKRYQLNQKNILEIGCGKGGFLKLLCKGTTNQCIGFDPSYDDSNNLKNITIIKDYYTEKYSHFVGDFYLSRHTLEHVQNPVHFISSIFASAHKNPSAILFVEVPNALYMLYDAAIWDIIYEHCSYFTPNSLSFLLYIIGFHVSSVYETYSRQFLCIEAKIENKNNRFQKQPESIERIVKDFSLKYEQKIKYWQNKINQPARDGKKVVIWGAGSKGVSFLNSVPYSNYIGYVVDINPKKQGKYIPGGGQEIVNEEFLIDYEPDIVLLSNEIYFKEIQNKINKMGLSPQFLFL